MSKYGVISGPYFAVFGLNIGKYGPEINSYLDTFHAVIPLVAASVNLEDSFMKTLVYIRHINKSTPIY